MTEKVASGNSLIADVPTAYNRRAGNYCPDGKRVFDSRPEYVVAQRRTGDRGIGCDLCPEVELGYCAGLVLIPVWPNAARGKR